MPNTQPKASITVGVIAIIASFVVPILAITFTAGGVDSKMEAGATKNAVQDQVLDNHTQRIQNLEIQNAVVKEQMKTVSETVCEIRRDVKELLNRDASKERP